MNTRLSDRSGSILLNNSLEIDRFFGYVEAKLFERETRE